MNGGRMHIGYWWESQKERDHQENLAVGEWIVLNWFLDVMGWYGPD
jgi:hypothetical protein